jgi:hypothetical protein
MKCSICKSNLYSTESVMVSGVMNEEYLTEKYICSDSSCVSHFSESWWDSDGQFYSSRFLPKVMFVDKMTGAFGSIQRRLDVEIYKKDENWIIFSIPKLIKINLKWRYQATEDGEILSRRIGYEIWIKETRGSGMVLYLSGFSMLRYCLKQVFKLKTLEDCEGYKRNSGNWDKRWWKRVTLFVVEHKITKFVLN